MEKSCAPIGVFDSGLGGISVLQTIHHVLPHEDLIYFGDSKRAPYGPQSVEQVRAYSDEIVQNMIDQGAKAVVIACNTATSAAAEYLRSKYPIPIIGMEPALKPAAMAHPGGKLAVMATEMTLREKKFASLLGRFEENHTILKVPAPDFVVLVDQGLTEGRAVEAVLSQLFPMSDQEDLDGIVLGCTHFVFLKKAISQYFKKPIHLYDGNLGTAKYLKTRLKALGLLCEKQEEGQVSIHNSAGQAWVDRSWILFKS